MSIVYSGSWPKCSRTFLKLGYGDKHIYIKTRLHVDVTEDCARLDWIPTYKDDEYCYYAAPSPHDLSVAAACLCAGLMPPSVFADLLEDHRPDLAEAAAFLREWEQVHKE